MRRFNKPDNVRGELTAPGKRITLLILCFQGALISFNISSIAGIIPAMSRALGIPDVTMGSVIVAYMVPYGLAALLYGPLSRLVNAKKVSLFCLTMFSVFSFISGVTNSFNLLIFSRVITGIAASAVIPLSLSLIGILIPYEKRGKAVGTFFSASFASSVTGVFLSGLLEWRLMFLIPACSGAALVMLVLLIFPSMQAGERKEQVRYLSVLFLEDGRSVFAYIFLIAFVYSAIYSWLGVFFARTFGMTQWEISLSLTCVGLGGILGELVGGVLADRVGRALTATGGVVMLFITTACIVYTSSPLVLGGVLFIHGCAWTINHSALSTVLTDFPSQSRAEAVSLNSSLRFISGGIGTAITGILINKGLHTVFLLCAAMFLMLALATRLMLKKSITPELVAESDIY